jgi:phosphoenolpyruvate-protein kinase (PTS system EI component)
MIEKARKQLAEAIGIEATMPTAFCGLVARAELHLEKLEAIEAKRLEKFEARAKKRLEKLEAIMQAAVEAYIKDSSYDVRDATESVLATLKAAAQKENPHVDDAMWAEFLTDFI